MKDTGLTDKEIDEIAKSNANDTGSDQVDLGEDAALVQDTVGDMNAIINDVNNYKQLKKEIEEAEFLNDSLGLAMGEDNELTPTKEDLEAQAKYEKEAAKPLTAEQKAQLEDLEHDLKEIDEDDFDLMDL